MIDRNGASENAAAWRSSQEHFNKTVSSGEKERADREEKNGPKEMAEEQDWMARKNETRNLEALAEGRVDAERMKTIEETLNEAKTRLDLARDELSPERTQNIKDKNAVKEIIKSLSNNAKSIAAENGSSGEKPPNSGDLRGQLKQLELGIKSFEQKQAVVDSLLQKVMQFERVKEKAKRKLDSY